MNIRKNNHFFLTKETLWECKFKFDGRKCISDPKWNNDKCRCKCEKHNICQKDYI